MATDESSPQWDAHETLLRKIAEMAERTSRPDHLALLAEAYAWVTFPNNSHGSSAKE